jgi:integrase
LTRERYELVLRRWGDIGHKDKLWNKNWLYNNALRDFKLHCRKAGIKLRGKLNIHALRKNMGQNLGNAGLPVQVAQKILGHSKTETTIKYYSQVDPYHMLQVKKVIEKRRARTDVTQDKTQSRSEKKYV